MASLKEALERAERYDDIAHVGSIARRYFAMNAFDGVITMVGVLAGARAAGVSEPAIVLVTGLTTAVAMGVSGFTGAYLTEAAERKRDLEDLEKQTLTKLGNTRVGRASRFAVVVVTAVDGLSPLLAAVFVLIPFFAAAWLPTIAVAYYASLGLALVCLFALGLFLGHISRGKMLVYGAKTTIAGVAAIAVSLLLGGIH